MPADPTLKPQPRKEASRSRRLWGAAAVLTIAGFCGASGLMLLDMRRDARDHAVTGEINLANALSQDIARNIELYDLSLRAVVDGLGEPGFADLPPRIQDLLLYDRAATAHDLGAMLVLDASGRVVRGSEAGFIGADLSDRQYFRALRADPGQGLFVSRPFRRRVTGDDEVIALARALHGADGAFAGVVVGTLRLAYLRDLFGTADLGPQGAVNLFLADGSCVLRVPERAGCVGRSIAGTSNFAKLSGSASGTFTADSAIDGIRRIYSFTRVGELPLILDVALAEGDVFAPWRAKAAVIGSALLALCAVAAALARQRAKGEEEHRLLAENAIDVVVRLDRLLRRTYVSPSCRAVLGYEPGEMLGGSPRETVHPDDWPSVSAWADGVRAGSGAEEAVFRVIRKDGGTLWVEGRCRAMARDAGFLVVLRDVSERRAAEDRAALLTAELARLAHSDALTGLANRRRFDEALTQRWSRTEETLSLLLLDVDRFKPFNDLYGHQQGDACLRAVARSIENAVDGPEALVARYGGEEIAVLLPHAAPEAAAQQAERVRAAVEGLALPHASGVGGLVTISVGCATAVPRESGEGCGALVAAADARLYEAKRLGRNRVVGASAAGGGGPAIDEEARAAALSRRLAEGRFDDRTRFDSVARLAGHLFGAPAAFVSLVGRGEVTFAGRHGLDVEALNREDAFCAHTVQGTEPLVVPDPALDPRFTDLPIVRSGCRFYAGAPITDPATGHALGALCIVDVAPRADLDRGQREVLKGLARLISEQIGRDARPSLAGASFTEAA